MKEKHQKTKENPNNDRETLYFERLATELILRIMYSNFCSALRLGRVNRRFRIILHTDIFWERFVPLPQRQKENNRSIFIENFKAIEKKLATSLLHPKVMTLTIKEGLFDNQLQQLLIIFSHLSFTAIEFPKLRYQSDNSEYIVSCYTDSGFYDAFNLNLCVSYISLSKKNFGFIQPVLAYLPMSRLSVTVSHRPEDISSEQLATLASIIAELPLTSLSLRAYEEDNLKSFLTDLLRFKIQYFLEIDLNGAVSQEEIDLFMKLLANNTAIYQLSIGSLRGKADLAAAFKNLMSTHLKILGVHSCSKADLTSIVTYLPSSLTALKLPFVYMNDAQFKLLVMSLPRTAISFLDVSGNEITDLDCLAEVLNRTQLRELIFDRNQRLKVVEKFLMACQNDDCKLTKLDFGGCQINESADHFINIISKNTNIKILFLYQMWSYGFADYGLNLYGQLAEAFSKNFTLLRMVYLHNSEEGYLLDKSVKQLSNRNSHLENVRNALQIVESHRDDLLSDKVKPLLKETIPQQIKQARDSSTQLMDKHPEAHEFCRQVCDELTRRTDNFLQQRRKQKSQLQFFKEKQQKELLAAKNLISEQQREFVNQLISTSDYKTLKEFATAMENNNYLVAAQIIMKFQANANSIPFELLAIPK